MEKAAEADAVAKKHEPEAKLFEDEEQARQGIRHDVSDDFFV